jgi:spore coat protein U-like protein
VLLPCLPAQACTASATAVNFGTYSRTSATPNDVNGTVTMTCPPAVVTLLLYSVSLSSGGGTYSARRMTSGAYNLKYQLYTDLSRNTVWGDGTSGTSVVYGGLTVAVLSAVSNSHTVYGRMPAQQSGVAAGTYNDTVIVTITY